MSRRAVLAAVIAAASAAAFAEANAEPMLTISCDKPNGFSTQYGTSLPERVQARENNQPEPAPSLKEPTKDGYTAKPTFIVDSNKTKMTAIWSELPEDVELRKKSKELNLPQMPPLPATEATGVWVFKNTDFGHRSRIAFDYDLFVFSNVRHSFHR